MTNSPDKKSMIYVPSEPDVQALATAYERTVGDLSWYLDSTRDSYNLRRSIWPGKSKDLRKHGTDAFPWENASDTECPVIDEKINTYIALFMTALSRANIRAYPVESGDMARAQVVSSFLKWMVSSYIPDFRRQMELGGNYLLERGIMATYVGWEKRTRTYLQKLDLNQIAQLSPPLAKMILEGTDDAAVTALLQQQFQGVNAKRAKKALAQLRKTGAAELPVVRQSVNRPHVCAQAPDGEVFFPAYTSDYQRAPYCFRRVLLSAQELEGRVASDGWDAEWVDQVIEGCAGDASMNHPRANTTQTRASTQMTEELYEVIYCYQRLISEEDKSEGIYCTVFCPKLIKTRRHNRKDGDKDYGKFELLNGYDDYPVVVTKLGEDNKLLYELATVPEQLRGIQWQVKVELDSRVDRNSLATTPPLLHPAGNPPSDWGPKVLVAYRRLGELQFGPVPPFNPGSVEIEQNLLNQANRIMGLEPENPLSAARQQWFVSKFLSHVRDVLRMAYKCYQRFGPDSVFFRVTGVTDPQRFSRGSPDEDFDIKIDFDVLNNDPENLEKQLQQMVSLVQLDRNGRINVDKLLEMVANSINPVMADSILQPAEAAAQQITKAVTDDLAKIYAGIEAGARPNGAQVALQTIQQYVQQPDVMQRLQQDEAFRGRLEKYQQQYVFQMQQAQNAEIGKIGTAPAQMGDVQTQGLTQGMG
jgi:hypothetical protein